MSRWTAPSDRDYAEEIGDHDGQATHAPMFRCVECNRKFPPLQAYVHGRETGHTIRYRGRLVSTKPKDAA